MCVNSSFMQVVPGLKGVQLVLSTTTKMTTLPSMVAACFLTCLPLLTLPKGRVILHPAQNGVWLTVLQARLPSSDLL